MPTKRDLEKENVKVEPGEAVGLTDCERIASIAGADVFEEAMALVREEAGGVSELTDAERADAVLHVLLRSPGIFRSKGGNTFSMKAKIARWHEDLENEKGRVRAQTWEYGGP